MALSLRKLTKSYGPSTQPVLVDLDLSIGDGEFMSIIGPSGCGKSTLCNLVAGLTAPEQGEIVLDGRMIQGCLGHVGYMPQKDLLLPWRTLLDNVIIGLEVIGVPKQKARRQGLDQLHHFGLGDFAHHYPHQLSGGMRQRGALLRTILYGKQTLLLDEPFGALDALTRREMHSWLLAVWQETRNTVLFITHDIDEAILLSDKVAVMTSRPARLEQVLSVPFARPRNAAILLSPPAIDLKRDLIALLDTGIRSTIQVTA